MDGESKELQTTSSSPCVNAVVLVAVGYSGDAAHLDHIVAAINGSKAQVIDVEAQGSLEDWLAGLDVEDSDEEESEEDS